MPPGEGLVRFAGGQGVPDYRGTARAFSLEDELAEVVLGDVPVRDIGEDLREAGLAPMLADPPINLRQGPFGRRRDVLLDRRRINWILALTIFLLSVSLLIQITSIVRTTFAADRILAEVEEARAALGKAGAERIARASFGQAASTLFDSVRDTPNAAVTQLAYQADGALRASILADTQATIDGIRTAIEARGMRASAGPTTPVGGRVSGEITVRPQ
jgi:general secretion pathway protein L